MSSLVGHCLAFKRRVTAWSRGTSLENPHESTARWSIQLLFPGGQLRGVKPDDKSQVAKSEHQQKDTNQANYQAASCTWYVLLLVASWYCILCATVGYWPTNQPNQRNQRNQPQCNPTDPNQPNQAQASPTGATEPNPCHETPPQESKDLQGRLCGHRLQGV